MATTPLGTYHLCAMADSGAAVPEGDETNNTRCTAATITVARPDLIMTQVLPTAAAVNAGGTLSVTNTVQNPGSLPAGSFAIAFRLSVNTIYGDGDDVVISTTRGGVSLAAGASSSASSSLTIPLTTPPGTYFVCAKADAGGAVTETDESDNTLCSSSTITVP